MTAKKQGLYANIHAKKERIAHGSGEHMRKAGEAGAPSGEDFKKAAKTEKPPKAARKSASKSASKSTSKKS